MDKPVDGLPFWPKSEAQKDFFNLEMQGVFEIGFGGTPYSGKTCCMVVSSLMYAHIPEYRAAFFRREATQLEKAGLIDEAKNWYYKADPKVEYNSITRTFKFSSGAVITFNGCEGELDYKKYDGVEWHALYFEELTHFTPDQITNLMSRVRNPKGKIPLRVRSSTNPGGPNEEWVINRYRPWLNKYTVDPLKIDIEAQNGDLLYYTNLEGQVVLSKERGKGYKSISYVCPSINDLSPDQEARVHGISDPIRRAALLGRWGVKAEAGMYFAEEWFKDAPAAPNTNIKLRYWDLAASGDKGDFLASILVAKWKDNYYIEDILLLKPQVHEVEAIVYKQAKIDGPLVAIAIEQEGGSAGKIVAHNFETKLKALGHRVYIDQKTSDRTTSSKEARAGIVSPLAKEGKIYLVNNPSVIRNRREFFKQVVGFPVEKHDDILDAMTGAIHIINNKYNGIATYLMMNDGQRVFRENNPFNLNTREII